MFTACQGRILCLWQVPANGENQYFSNRPFFTNQSVNWKTHLWLNILKGTSCRKTVVLKVKVVQNYGPLVNFEISHIVVSSILILFAAWRIWGKKQFLCIDFWIVCTSILLQRFPNSKSLFLIINFSLTCYDISNEIAIFWECKVWFQKFLPQNRAERTATFKKIKSQYRTSYPTGPCDVMWVTFVC